MALRIDPDHRRFRDIVRGKIKQDLRTYISQGELIGRKGKDLVSIPLPQINWPRFRFGSKDRGGVGQGAGDVGDSLGKSDPNADGSGKAGDQAGEHALEVELSLEELAQIMGEELQLPRIEPKGKQRIIAQKDRYVGIRRSGPESLRHFKRTFRQALRRQIMTGTYDPQHPMIVPVREDRRYRSWRTSPLPQSNAVMIFIMDVSGSMGDEQKEIVRIESFWIDAWRSASTCSRPTSCPRRTCSVTARSRAHTDRGSSSKISTNTSTRTTASWSPRSRAKKRSWNQFVIF